jgi:hypothetical protein
MLIANVGISSGQCGKILTMIVVFLSLFAAAHAQPAPPSTCLIYRSGSTSTPAIIRTLMSRFGDEFAEACLTRQSVVSQYYSVMTPWLDRLSVCHYQELERNVRSGVNIGLSIEYMRLSSSSSCPPPARSDYVAVSSLSPGTFAVLQRFWNRLGASYVQFSAALSKLPKEERETPAFSRVVDVFRLGGGGVPLRRVALTPNYPGLIRTGYVLEGPMVHGKAIALYVDVTEDGPAVFALGLLVE